MVSKSTENSFIATRLYTCISRKQISKKTDFSFKQLPNGLNRQPSRGEGILLAKIKALQLPADKKSAAVLMGWYFVYDRGLEKLSGDLLRFCLQHKSWFHYIVSCINMLHTFYPECWYSVTARSTLILVTLDVIKLLQFLAIHSHVWKSVSAFLHNNCLSPNFPVKGHIKKDFFPIAVTGRCSSLVSFVWHE